MCKYVKWYEWGVCCWLFWFTVFILYYSPGYDVKLSFIFYLNLILTAVAPSYPVCLISSSSSSFYSLLFFHSLSSFSLFILTLHLSSLSLSFLVSGISGDGALNPAYGKIWCRYFSIRPSTACLDTTFLSLSLSFPLLLSFLFILTQY